MAKNEKIVEASAIMLKELDSLRRQKREWELQRATLLAEVDFSNERRKLCMKEYEELAEQFATLSTLVDRLKTKLDAWEKCSTQESWTVPDRLLEAYSDPDDDDTDDDGPDDVDVERMQSTADHDPEAMPNG